MQRILPWLALCACLALPALLWAATGPPSDRALISQFARERGALQRLVAEAHSDGLDLYIGASGTVWPADLAERGLAAGRVATYRALLREAGVSSLSSSRDLPAVAFQVHSPLPLGPVKSYVYSPARPPALTDGPTEGYRFGPGELRRVCRPLADDWYLCLDHED